MIATVAAAGGLLAPGLAQAATVQAHTQARATRATAPQGATRATAPQGATRATAPQGATRATAKGATGAQPSAGKNARYVCAKPTKPGVASCLAIERTDKNAGVRPFAAGTLPPGYGPADLTSAYNLPSATKGKGQTVAIVDAYDDPNAQADLAVYRAQYGLPACTTANGCFRKVDQRGGTIYPVPQGGWSGEISLDLDMVSAACPQCHILLVEADNAEIANLGASVNTAVRLGAKYVSNSYGGSEDPTEGTWDTKYYKHPGVVITASTGDYGYEAGVEYPSASRYVTAVGGTSLSKDATAQRGWTESAWSGTGSGCSAYEGKPSWQHDQGCGTRMLSDVSAVADPQTGVAVYDTYATPAPGWDVFGGTSAAAPLVASAYALAGTPAKGSYPNSYPYGDTAALNDVTSGNNGTCDTAYYCTAGSGYDGPTGLGTPQGTKALAMQPHGFVAGTVSDKNTGKPVPGAAVSVGAWSTTTGQDGGYNVAVPDGTYQLTVSQYGYTGATVDGVTVGTNATVAKNVALAPLPATTLTGVVTDTSGHGWPLYAHITAAGTPLSVYTNPRTGSYSLNVLQGTTYQVTVAPVAAGYQPVTQQVQIGTTASAQDFAVGVNQNTCTAPGYAFNYTGSAQTFDATSAPDGWTVANNNGQPGWEFDNPASRANTTGGSGNFAIVDSAHDSYQNAQDTDLISPVTDLSAATTPILQFDADLPGWWNDTAGADLSTDGGQTWTNVWENDGWPGVPGPQTVVVPLPAAAGQASAQVRFHYTGANSSYWELDNVFFGNRACQATSGALVTGRVTDKNTGKPVNGVTVTASGRSTQSAATPGDQALNGGYYAMFVPAGATQLTFTQPGYQTVTQNIAINPDQLTTANAALPAGRIAISKLSIGLKARMGGTTSAKITVRNTGSATATVRLSSEPGGFTIAAQTPAKLVRGSYTLAPPRTRGKQQGAPTQQAAAASAWASIADYPQAILDQAMVTDPHTGKVYSFGGDGGASSPAAISAVQVYDPGTDTWKPLASMRYAREQAEAAYINGRIYVTGGWGTDGNPVPQTEIYDVATGKWSAGANTRVPVAAAGVATYNARMYLIGGCDTYNCGHLQVQVYDPAANRWRIAGNYPEPTSWLGCGTVYGKIYCAGGQNNLNGAAETTDAFGYDPSANRWTRIASLPIQMAAMGSAVAGNRLILADGVTGGEQYLTNRSFAYSPDDNAWNALPNTATSVYRAASACGLYLVGGSAGGLLPTKAGVRLPGYGNCPGQYGVGWLRYSPGSVTLRPGASVTVKLTVRAAHALVPQPGKYHASLAVATSTPYPSAPVALTLTATPPKSWGKIAGTIWGPSCHGNVRLVGATVQINTKRGNFTLQTDANGRYALWLDKAGNPATLIVAASGYKPQTRAATIVAGRQVVANFTLKRMRACG